MFAVLKVREKYQLCDVEIVLLMGETPSAYDVTLCFERERAGVAEPARV